MVVILCFLSTITTNFEFELTCSKVGFDFKNEKRCNFNPSNVTWCHVDVFDPICKSVRFDESTGQPCPVTNRTQQPNGSCQEVENIKIHLIIIIPLIKIFSSSL